MPELPPSHAFAQRLKETRESAGISQPELERRLLALGYTQLRRRAILEIERWNTEGRGRRVTIDDVLACAAALGVAPVNLLVPFESDKPAVFVDRIHDPETGESREATPEDMADRGWFVPRDVLRVGDLVLGPGEARAWVRGRELYAEASDNLELRRRFYFEQAEPPRRNWLARLVAAARAGRPLPRARFAEDRVRKRLVRWPSDVRRELQEDFVAALIAEEERKEREE
jgi:transcriptional regulator with XRE-family HTH domain